MRALVRVLTTLLAVLAVGLGFELRATEGPGPRIVAIGDVHGSPEAFSGLLRAAKLVDDSGAWIGGDAVLVQTGDLTDRGPGVREVLDLIRDLEQSAEANGGRVVSLLGNHEVYNLIGYYDYQSTPLPVFAAIASSFVDDESDKTRKKAYKQWASWARTYPSCRPNPSKQAWMAVNPLGFVEYQEALSPRGGYGKWLRQKKIAAKVGDVLFVHGGLSPELAEMGIASVDAINRRAAAELDQFDRDREWLAQNGVIPDYPTLGEMHCAVANELFRTDREIGGTAESRRGTLEQIQRRLPDRDTWMLLNPSGPVWFRGYASWTDEEAEAELATVLGTFEGKRVVVGHTPQLGKVVPRFDGRVFLIDTAMAYPELRGRAVALEIRGDEVAAISESGRVSLGGQAPPASGASTDEPLAVEPEEEPSTGSRSPSYPANSEVRVQWSGTEPGSAELVAGLAAGHGQAESRTRPETGPHPGAREPAESNLAADEPAGRGAQDAAGGPPSSRRGWLGPDGDLLPFADEDAVLDFLETARIVEREKLGKGVTRAEKLLLEKDDIRARAVFHDVHDERQRHNERARSFLNFRDSYRNNLAAYELGRLLGLTNMVPTTRRKVGGAIGSIQLWIEEAIDDAQRRERGGNEALSVYLRRRISDMWVFDNLINNIDRNQGNMLHDSRGEFWMIDHTRTLNAASRLPNPEKIKRCSRDLLEAIRNLDEDLTRQRLKPHLRAFEIKALWARRGRLLEYLDKRVSAIGEDKVLFSYGDPDDQVTVYYPEDDAPASPDSQGTGAVPDESGGPGAQTRQSSVPGRHSRS